MKFIHARPEALDLNLLRVFEVVFRERHLTRAADQLALTPSAISHALRRLRSHLGDPLFVRKGTAMVPTATCQQMAPPLFEHLAQMKKLLQHWGRFDPATSQQGFRLGMPEGLEVMILNALLGTFFSAAPSASLATMAYERGNLGRLLASGQIDLAFDIAHAVCAPIRHCPLLMDRFCVVGRKGRRLKDGMSLDNYLKAQHIAVSRRMSGATLEDAALLDSGLTRVVSARCQNYHTAIQAAGASDFLLTVPRILGTEASKAYGLSVWDVPFPIPMLRLHLFWHAANDDEVSSVWLRQLIRDLVGNRWPEAVDPVHYDLR